VTQPFAPGPAELVDVYETSPPPQTLATLLADTERQIRSAREAHARPGSAVHEMLTEAVEALHRAAEESLASIEVKSTIWRVESMLYGALLRSSSNGAVVDCVAALDLLRRADAAVSAAGSHALFVRGQAFVPYPDLNPLPHN
jgi:hypothetical protein